MDGVKADIFNSLTDKLLYIIKITIPDIEPAVALFTTRVAESNVDNWKKLRRCISYLDQTVDDVRIIGVLISQTCSHGLVHHMLYIQTQTARQEE